MFDIAISFAGEDRKIAENFAKHLVNKGLSVFYDEYQQADLWGKDLYTHLTKVYKDDSKYCLMLLSKDYIKKQWTSHERRAAQARAFSENQEYILPLRLDNTTIDGILDTTGYIDYYKIDFEKIVELIVKKIHQYNKDHGIKYDIVKAEEVLKLLNIESDVLIKDSIIRTECPTCGTNQYLSEATISLQDDDTLYLCKNGCQPIVVISRPGVENWMGRGYRINNYVIRNTRDLILEIKGKGYSFKACNASLMKTKPKY